MGSLETGRRYLLRGSEILGIPEVRDDITSVVKGVLAEFLGTTLVVFVWTGTVMATASNNNEQSEPSRIAVSLCVGFIVAAMVFVTQQVSGGHLNPTVTFGNLIAFRISALKGILFIVAQIVGGIAGGAILQGISGEMMPHSRFNRTVTIPTHDLNDGQAMGVETLAAIIIALTALMVVYGNRSHGFSGTGPILIGFSMAACHFAFVSYSGAGLNPARSFGPAVLTGVWNHHWIYWVGPLIGAVIAALLFLFVFKPRPETIEVMAPASDTSAAQVQSKPIPLSTDLAEIRPSETEFPDGHEHIEIPVIPTFTPVEGASIEVEVHREVEIR